MRSLLVVCLLLLNACRVMNPAAAPQDAAPREHVVLVCRGDAAAPSCRSVNVTQYRAMVRGLDRPLTGSHIAR